MNTQKFDGKITSAYGNPIPEIAFNGTFEAYGPDKKVYLESDWEAALDEVKTANKFPSAEEIVTFVNNKMKANARQKAMQSALDAAGIKKPEVNATPEGLLVAAKQMVKTLVAAGKNEADAIQQVNVLLGTNLTA
jgi:hypothetical protein